MAPVRLVGSPISEDQRVGILVHVRGVQELEPNGRVELAEGQGRVVPFPATQAEIQGDVTLLRVEGEPAFAVAYPLQVRTQRADIAQVPRQIDLDLVEAEGI